MKGGAIDKTGWTNNGQEVDCYGTIISLKVRYVRHWFTFFILTRLLFALNNFYYDYVAFYFEQFISLSVIMAARCST